MRLQENPAYQKMSKKQQKMIRKKIDEFVDSNTPMTQTALIGKELRELLFENKKKEDNNKNNKRPTCLWNQLKIMILKLLKKEGYIR